MTLNCAVCGKPAPTWQSTCQESLKGIVYHTECNPTPLGMWSHFIPKTSGGET